MNDYVPNAEKKAEKKDEEDALARNRSTFFLPRRGRTGACGGAGRKPFTLLAACLFVFAAFGGEQKTESEKTPEEWAGQLGAADFDARAEAAQRLKDLGPAAKAALEKAVKSEDLEVRRTAAALLRLLGAAEVVLVVRDPAGKPVKNAKGELVWSSRESDEDFGGIAWRNTENEPAEPVTTDAAGEIRLERRKPAPFGFTIKLDEYQPALGHVESCSGVLRNGDVARILHLVSRGGRVSAVLTDEQTGKPVADVRARLVSPLKNWEMQSVLFSDQFGLQNALEGVSDAEGAVEFKNVPPGFWLLLTSGADYEWFFSEPFRLLAGEWKKDWAVRLTPAPREKGAIRFPCLTADGKPLPKDAVVSASYFFIPAGKRGALMRALREDGRQEHKQPTALPNNVADEHGVVVLSDLPPGEYEIAFRLESSGENDNAQKRQSFEHGLKPHLVFRDLIVRPGATTELPAAKFPKGLRLTGALEGSGKERNPFAYGVQLRVLREEDVLKYPASQWRNLMWRSGSSFFQDTPYAAIDKEGTFSIFGISPMKPGEKAVVLVQISGRRADNQYMFWGVDLTEDGKTVALPSLPDPDKKDAAQGIGTIRGRVFAPEGINAQEIRLTASGGGSSFSAIAKKDGGFEIRSPGGHGGGYTRLQATAPNCRPILLDLTQPQLDPMNLTIHLEPMCYGDMKITATDETGKPLAGVRVGPVSGDFGLNREQRYFRQRGLENRVLKPLRTGAQGVAVLRGLQSGRRRFFAVSETHYLPEVVEALVPAAGVTELTLRLKPKLSIAGRVIAPAGTDFSALTLNCWSNDAFGRSLCRFPIVNAEGLFSCPQLSPGEYRLSAEAPGATLVAATEKLALHTEVKDIVLRLAERCGLAVGLEMPTEKNDSRLIFFPPQCFLRLTGLAEPPEESFFSRYAGLDKNHWRFEFDCLAPGTYEIWIADPDRRDRAELPGVSLIRGSRRAGVAVAVPLAQKENAAAELKLTAVNLSEPSATVNCVLTAPAEALALMKTANQNYHAGGIILKWTLESPDGRAEYVQSLYQLGLKTVHFNPPPEVKKTTEEGEPARFTGLSPGQAKLTAQLVMRFDNLPGLSEQNVERLKIAPRLIREFALEAGKTLDLGRAEYVLTEEEAALLKELAPLLNSADVGSPDLLIQDRND